MKNLKTKIKKQGGFTLVEMLIVVAIIAILIAIAVPLVNNALESAREATDSANERAALGIAMAEVLADGKLAGQDVSTSSASAYYKIDNTSTRQGSLVKTDDKPDGYGKGTKLGSVSDIHTNKVIKITYDPTKTDEEKQWTIEWE